MGLLGLGLTQKTIKKCLGPRAAGLSTIHSPCAQAPTLTRALHGWRRINRPSGPFLQPVPRAKQKAGVALTVMERADVCNTVNGEYIANRDPPQAPSTTSITVLSIIILSIQREFKLFSQYLQALSSLMISVMVFHIKETYPKDFRVRLGKMART